MVFDTCRVPECGRAIRANRLCIKHNQEWLRDVPFSVLPPLRTPTDCGFEDCGRPARYKGLCKEHRMQQRKGRDLYPIGDKAAVSAIKRAAWDRLTPVQQAERIANSIGKANGYVRTPELRRRISASRVGRSPNIHGQRNCFGCGEPFIPKSGPQTWCSVKCRSDQRRAREHGMTLAELQALQAGQNGVCAICSEAKPLHIDHDHVTGKVRGLLCSTCNTGLGKLGDSADNLRRALAYLER